MVTFVGTFAPLMGEKVGAATCAGGDGAPLPSMGRAFTEGHTVRKNHSPSIQAPPLTG